MITCPDCSFQSPPGARFCAGCGKKLPAVCAGCGAELLPGGRFCAQCGQPVEAAAAPSASGAPAPPPSSAPAPRSAPVSRPSPVAEPSSRRHGLPPDDAEQTLSGELRLVTILFADIVGSTAMGEQADPEDLAELVNGAFAIMNRAVDDAGGHVARLMGDGLLALFGAPVAHEDDPQRAIRAALGIRDGVRAYGEGIAGAGGVAVQVRVGINSGLVLAGQVGSDIFSEYTALGDAANVAARLEAAAPTGEIVISESTARLLRGAVALEPYGPLALKGKSEPVPAFRVTGVAPAIGSTFRGLPGVQTPLVGRAGERARLISALEDAVESRSLGWITLCGDAGVGKSRLLATFLEDLAASDIDAQVVRGRCVEQVAEAYELLRSILTLRYGIEAGTPAEAAREQLRAGAEADLSGRSRLDAQRAGRDLARLVFPEPKPEDDPRGLAERGLAALAALALAWTASRPLVLALEDLHWADDSSLDALARMAEGLADAPAFILANARPSLFSRRPLWGEGEQGHVRLDLRPLSQAAVGRLLAALLASEGHEGLDLPDAVVRFVSERSEGNAYYIEELCQMLRAREMLVPGEAAWQLELERLELDRVPTTLQGMLQARLDALDPADRQALQQASVLGKVFWDGALQALGSGDHAQLKRLRERGLVLARERSSIPGQREFVFKHALLRDAAYGSLLKRARKPLHGRAADWLIAQAGERYAELGAQIGRHAEAAGRPAEAARHYRAAADRARATYANQEASGFYRRAEELWPADDAAGRFACLQGDELVLDMLGQREEQREALERMAEVAEALDDRSRSYVFFRRSWLALRMGDPVEAEIQARRALAEAGDIVEARANAMMSLGNALQGQDRNVEAIECFQSALTLHETSSDDRGAAKALHGLATSNEAIEDFATAGTDFERALSIFQGLDDLSNEARTLTNLAILNAMQERLDEAAPLFESALACYRAAGDRVGEGKALHNLGFLAAEQGDLGNAEQQLRKALGIFRGASHRSDEAAVLRDMADVLRRAGKVAEAAIIESELSQQAEPN